MCLFDFSFPKREPCKFFPHLTEFLQKRAQALGSDRAGQAPVGPSDHSLLCKVWIILELLR